MYVTLCMGGGGGYVTLCIGGGGGGEGVGGLNRTRQ